MNGKIDDETYRKMSEVAYDDYEKGDVVSDLPGWRVLEDTHSNNISGFDAVTFYNPETKQAVIAYRGTEGDSPILTSGPDFIMDGRIGIPEIGRKIDQSLDFTPEWLDKGAQKVRDFTGATKVENWLGDLGKKLDKTSFAGKNNQMYEAEDYAKEMQKKYKDYNFSLTGHSLGGGNAQYAAAYTGMTAVTFSAPSVISSLTPEMQRKAEEGGFDDQITNFAHPGDFVASGLFGGYDRHVGATYYINSNYEDANKDVGIAEKIGNSFGGPNYHSLNQYKFENGYISNDLYDPITGEKIDYSPREPSDLVENLMKLGKDFGNHVFTLARELAAAAAMAGTIQVTPAELRSVAVRWKNNAQRSNEELNKVNQLLTQYLHSSRSQRLEPIVTRLDVSMKELGTWHMKRTNEFLTFIEQKAEQFEQADRS